MSVVLAMLLDAILGEPKWLWSRFPHPVVLMGRLIGLADVSLNQGSWQKVKGLILVVLLVSGFALSGLFLQWLPGSLAEILMGAILVAQRSLVDHVHNVAQNLGTSLEDGRRSVAMIVGRDTAGMNEAAVSRAAIESAAENFSDGVIAPLFWFVLAGLPGLLVYKVINTADSMIGHRTQKHEEFGWAAARFDDLLNFLPARLTALLFVIMRPDLWHFAAIRDDAHLHRSPNAGWPEAALSRVLDVSLSGPRTYHGTLTHYPWVNDCARKDVGVADIERSVRELWKAWAIAFLIAPLPSIF